MKKIFIIIPLFLALSLLLTACSAGEFLASLGFDTHDYDGEPVIKEYETDSEKALELTENLKILTVNSAVIPSFEGTSDAAKKCRQSVLNYMYNTNFAKYTGNPQLLDEAAEIYPQMRFSVVIPGNDFVNVFYKYFGGKEKIANQSCEMFEYLPKIDAYITAAQPQKNDVEITVISLCETENTFRLKFSTSLDSHFGGTYFALIVKRADESCYFRKIEHTAT